MKSLFYSSAKLERLMNFRKKAQMNAKKFQSKDQMQSHSYEIMLQVIDQKLSALSVNK